MPLPTEAAVSAELKSFLESNKTQDPDQALQDFCDKIASIIIGAIKDGDVTGVTTLVTGAAGSVPVSGTGTQNNIAKIS